MLRVQNYECMLVCVGAANAYIKRDIENPFSDTYMFMQARNNDCLQQKASTSMYL